MTREAVNERNRIDGNLNQIAHHANATGDLRANLDATLAELVRAISWLIDVR